MAEVEDEAVSGPLENPAYGQRSTAALENRIWTTRLPHPTNRHTSRPRRVLGILGPHLVTGGAGR